MEINRKLISFDRTLDEYGCGYSSVTYAGVVVGSASFSKVVLIEAEADSFLEGIPSPVYQKVAAWAKSQDHEAFLASNPEYGFMLRWNIRRTARGLVRLTNVVFDSEDNLRGGQRDIEVYLSEAILSHMSEIQTEADFSAYVIK